MFKSAFRSVTGLFLLFLPILLPEKDVPGWNKLG